jgi:hypothetical protein
MIQRDNTPRAVELMGDSPELIAFVILKSIIQVEQARDRNVVLDKEWLLSNYADCLAAVKGEYVAKEGLAKGRRPAKQGT